MFLMFDDVNSSAQLLTKIMFEPLEIDKNFRHADVEISILTCQAWSSHALAKIIFTCCMLHLSSG